MNFTSFDLVSFKEEDTYINGLRFQLLRNDVKKIISYFKNLNKWTEYYYHEIGEYNLTHIEILEILNLYCPFWFDKDLKFCLIAWSSNHLLTNYNAGIFESDKLLIFQSKYKKDEKYESHSFLLVNEDINVVQKLNLTLNTSLPENILSCFSNSHRQFDTDNFIYVLKKIDQTEIYFDTWKDIELEPALGYWDEE